MDLHTHRQTSCSNMSNSAATHMRIVHWQPPTVPLPTCEMQQWSNWAQAEKKNAKDENRARAHMECLRHLLLPNQLRLEAQPMDTTCSPPPQQQAPQQKQLRLAKPTGAKLTQKNHQKCHFSMSNQSVAKASDQSCSGASVQFQSASLGQIRMLGPT